MHCIVPAGCTHVQTPAGQNMALIAEAMWSMGVHMSTIASVPCPVQTQDATHARSSHVPSWSSGPSTYAIFHVSGKGRNGYRPDQRQSGLNHTMLGSKRNAFDGGLLQEVEFR